MPAFGPATSTVSPGLETITWVDPDGASFVLTDTRGIIGRGLPPVTLDELVVPLQPGSRFRSVRDQARQVVIPVLVQRDTMVEHRDNMRALAASLHPSNDPGVLRVATVDGETRELTCWYVDGFQWSEEWPDFAEPSLLFKALDPYWYDSTDTQQDFTSGVESGSWFPMTFPMTLAIAEVFATATVDNTGDVEVWPVWEITGPGSDFVLRNLTTGETLALTYTVPAVSSVTIDTRPGVKTVTASDGTNLFPNLSATSSLWSLVKGINSLQIEFAGASADSIVSVRYRLRRLTA